MLDSYGECIIRTQIVELYAPVRPGFALLRMSSGSRRTEGSPEKKVQVFASFLPTLENADF
jgi:hypothetical protein